MMIRFRQFALAYVSGAVFMFCLFAFHGNQAVAADGKVNDIDVELTESFYRALRAEGANKTYRTDISEEYLRQIAVSSRFTVESNLKIIKQQERIIELLESLQKKKN
jgi:hypothetical protein